MSPATEDFRQWIAQGGQVDGEGNPRVFYHGSVSGDTLDRFIPGGPIGARQNGDSYGVASYFTSSAAEASTYASGGGDEALGAVFPVYLRGELLELSGPLSAEHAARLTEFARQSLLPSDKARFSSGRKQLRIADVDEARAFFDSQRLKWDELGDGMCRALPEVSQDGELWVIEYTDFTSEIDISTGEEAYTLFRAVGWDSLVAAGFDGMRLERDGGATWVVMHRPDGNVKSAVGNVGTFNPWDASILHSIDPDDSHGAALDETRFWGRRGAGSVVLARSTGRLLLPLRSEAVLEPGTWGTWGGAIDHDESPEAAAKRELYEEAGMPEDMHVHLKPLYVFESGSFRYHNHLAVIDEEFAPELNWESEAFGWFDLDSLPSPLHPGLQALLADQRSMGVIRSHVPGAAVERVGRVISELVGLDADQLKVGVGSLVVTTSDQVADQVLAARKAAFGAWFAGSKVVDSEGSPLVVYHGTGADITEFNVANGAWFSADPEYASDIASRAGAGENLIPAYLRIGNPMVVSGDRAPAYTIEEAKSKGHDGIVGRGFFVAFLPEQIKSAIGNRGTYDPHDHDITHSLAAGELPDRAQAFHDRQSGVTFFLADRIKVGKEASVLLHETVHSHGRAHLPEGQFDALVGQVKAWAGHAQGSTERSIHDKAMRRVRLANVSAALEDEELFAYAVEEAVAMGVQPSALAHEGSAETWLSAVVQSIQRVADKLIGNSLEHLDGQDLVDLAYALAQVDRPGISPLIERALALDVELIASLKMESLGISSRKADCGPAGSTLVMR